MKTISRYIMTLALLLTAVTGAWADEPKVYDSGDVELFSLQVGDILMPGVTLTNSDVNNIAGANIISNRYSIDGVISQYSNSISSISFSIGENGLLTAELAGNGPYNCMPITEDGKAGNAWVVTDIFAEPNYKTILIGGTTDPNTITVTPVTGKTNEWTFTMPAFDVEIAPIYAPVAQWAKVDNVDQLPTALEGIYAESTDAIVKAGTVAKIGETVNLQGTVMYAVGKSATEQPALTDFSADVPTAEKLAAGDVYVWYYIKGADTPEGETASAENTFNDSEICTTPLTVTVLSNKFDIQFKAANANTIEAGKATVKVGDEAAEVKEGKLTGVKMDSKVTVTAKEGYKFRKVEVKKYEAPSLNITSPEVGQVIGSDGKNYAYANLPTGVTAVAKICLVSGNNGLALALTDEESKINWSTAIETCAAHTPAFTGGTWKLASQEEWNNMISAAGSYSALRVGFSSVGGTNMQWNTYWSSTESGPSNAWYYDFGYGSWHTGGKGSVEYVRACLAF